jgi:hypothetical protein
MIKESIRLAILAAIKNISMKFIIDLNTKLSIYKSQDGLELELIYSREKVNGILNLSETFEQTFINLIDAYSNEDKIFVLFIGDNAGFMDSRIAYIWLRNNQFFNKEEFYVARQSFSLNNGEALISRAIDSRVQDLAYSKEPNIGSTNGKK